MTMAWFTLLAYIQYPYIDRSYLVTCNSQLLSLETIEI